MKARLICLVRRHQWHNGWDEDRHQTVWTCKRCGATKRSDDMGASGLPSVARRHRNEEAAAAETRRRFDQDFRQGAVRIVPETGKPIAQVARELGINEGTLGTGVPRTGGVVSRAVRRVRTSGPS